MNFTSKTTLVTVVLALSAGCAGGEPPKEPEVRPALTPEAMSGTAVVEVAGPLRGMMTYLADAARFTECASGASYAMAMEADYLAAERGYTATDAQGEPLLVTFDGFATRRPGMEGGEVDAVVVTAFTRAWPGEGCGAESVEDRLEGTEWRLVELPGAARLPAEAHATLLLDREARQSSGTAGCNRFTASYTLDGGRLNFGLSAMTRMACQDGLDVVETDYMEALRLTGAYRFRDGFLELLGEAGPVARFASES